MAVAGLLSSADGFGAGPRRAFAGAAGLHPASAVGFLSALPPRNQPAWLRSGVGEGRS